jgi:hypothetical protein
MQNNTGGRPSKLSKKAQRDILHNWLSTTVADLALTHGVHINTIYNFLRKNGLRKNELIRPPTIRLNLHVPVDTRSILQEAAAKRQMTINALIRRLLGDICASDLFDAVLDDKKEED